MLMRSNSGRKKIYRLLVTLIEIYESQQYSIAASSLVEVLQHIMEYSGLKQSDLAEIMGASSDVTSDIVNGKRTISKNQAKALGQKF